MKYRIVHFLQKYFLNPQIKILFAIGVVPPGHSLLETTGRKTARPRRSATGVSVRSSGILPNTG